MPGTASSGGRGTNAKSRAQHEAAGTYRKDRHGDLRSPEPTPGRPEPPEDLDNVGQKAWDWLMWAFEDMGMLHKVDAATCYAYCRLWSKTMAVETQQDELRETLRILEENRGDLKEMSPIDRQSFFTNVVMLQKLISKCTDQSRSGWMAIRQYLVEFGLTPASRGRIKLTAKKEEADPFTAFQQQRTQIARVK